MRPVDDWLAVRLAGAPPELGAAIRELVDEVPAAGTGAEAIPEHLAAAALAGFEGVLAETEVDRRSRRAALRLLAADAALTYAFEAAVDLGTDPWRLADRLGPNGLLGERLASAGPAGSRDPRAGGERGAS